MNEKFEDLKFELSSRILYLNDLPIRLLHSCYKVLLYYGMDNITYVCK